MGKYFGTDGFRGEANVTLTAEQAFSVGRFLGWYYGEQKRRAGEASRVRVVIGKDTRRSGDMLECALLGGLLASGADVDRMGVTTTPAVAYATQQGAYDGGVMITASHNPYSDNGIKLLNAKGEKIEDEIEALAEAYLDGNLVTFGQPWKALPHAKRADIGSIGNAAASMEAYRAHLLACAPASLQGLRIGLDCANGSASVLAKEIFDALGATTYVIHASPDGLNINRDAGSTHMDALQRLVAAEGLDIGFAYDGDADRCMFVDERGEFVQPDYLVPVVARGAATMAGESLKGTKIIHDVRTSRGAIAALEQMGAEPLMVPVGHAFAKPALRESGALCGGELAGHYYFRDFHCCDSGVLAALMVLGEIASAKRGGQSFSTMISPICTAYANSGELNFKVEDKDAAMARMLAAAERHFQNEVSRCEIDGIRVEYPDGWFNIRKSNTEAYLRLIVECKSKEQLAQWVSILKKEV